MGTIQCSNSSTLNKQNSATVSLLYTQKLVIPIRWWQNLQSVMKTDWNHYGFLFLCFALMLYPFSEWSDFLVGQEIRFSPIRNWGSALLWMPRGLGVLVFCLLSRTVYYLLTFVQAECVRCPWLQVVVGRTIIKNTRRGCRRVPKFCMGS